MIYTHNYLAVPIFIYFSKVKVTKNITNSPNVDQNLEYMEIESDNSESIPK